MMKTTPTRKAFGKRLRKLRKEKDISQEKLGELAGLHRTYIGAIERGEESVSVDNKIAKALKVKPSKLLDS
jgi:transcriptional regulator with XRE-family HTH domain